MKHCKKCGEDKPLDQFHKNKSKHDGLTTYCKECWKEYERNRAKRDPRGTFYRFGLTADSYNAILVEQGYGCAICGFTPGEGDKRLAIDHCHTQGHVRGLLCMTCNTGLGKFRDDPDLLTKAIGYLDRARL